MSLDLILNSFFKHSLQWFDCSWFYSAFQLNDTSITTTISSLQQRSANLFAEYATKILASKHVNWVIFWYSFSRKDCIFNGRIHHFCGSFRELYCKWNYYHSSIASLRIHLEIIRWNGSPEPASDQNTAKWWKFLKIVIVNVCFRSQMGIKFDWKKSQNYFLNKSKFLDSTSIHNKLQEFTILFSIFNFQWRY